MLILYDFDDTLVRTYKASIKCFKETVLDLRLNPPSDKEIINNYGLTLEAWIKSLFNNVDIEKFIDISTEKLSKEELPVITGAKECIANLYDLGFKQGLLTNRLRDGLLKRLELVGYGLDYFKIMITAEDMRYPKPDGRAFDPVFDLGYKKEEILYVGDNLNDYFTAKNAQIDFFAVLTGLTQRESFIERGLDTNKIIKSVKYLPNRLKNNTGGILIK